MQQKNDTENYTDKFILELRRKYRQALCHGVGRNDQNNTDVPAGAIYRGFKLWNRERETNASYFMEGVGEEP